jgi:uncharacterized protein YndB with AHSA1/START domain
VIVRRTRNVAAAPQVVWNVVSDPERLPDWWPGVLRVEEVGDDAWTNVLSSGRGKLVRADYTLLERTPEQKVAWRHEVAESPFERILADSRTEIELESDAGGTNITLAVIHEPLGWARLAPFQLRSATRKQVDEALAGLAAVVEAEEDS